MVSKNSNAIELDVVASGKINAHAGANGLDGKVEIVTESKHSLDLVTPDKIDLHPSKLDNGMTLASGKDIDVSPHGSIISH